MNQIKIIFTLSFLSFSGFLFASQETRTQLEEQRSDLLKQQIAHSKQIEKNRTLYKEIKDSFNNESCTISDIEKLRPAMEKIFKEIEGLKESLQKVKNLREKVEEMLLELAFEDI